MAGTDEDIERLIPALRRFALGLVRDPHRADDLVQDCLERALAAWRRPRDSELAPWLYTILHNRHRDLLRQQRRRGTEVAIEEATYAGIPANQHGRLEARQALDALALLSDEHRAVLLLVSVEDLSYEETARVLGVPLGTVMSRLSRARQHLRLLTDSAGPRLRRVI